MVTYAVEMRYDDEIYPTAEQIQAGIDTVRELRQKVFSLLPLQKSNEQGSTSIDSCLLISKSKMLIGNSQLLPAKAKC